MSRKRTKRAIKKLRLKLAKAGGDTSGELLFLMANAHGYKLRVKQKPEIAHEQDIIAELLKNE